MSDEMYSENVQEVVTEQTTEATQKNDVVEAVKRKAATKLMPSADLDLLAVAKLACAKWKETPDFKLLWKSCEEFENDINEFELSLSSKKNAGAVRTPLSKKLSIVNKTIDHLLIYIKDSLKDKYGKDTYQAYFPEFGIAFYKGVYRLPADQQERRQALTMLVSAIVKHDLQGQNSQISVWQNLKDEFDQCIADSTENTTTSTKFVGDKKLLRPTVKKALDSLTHLIKGNYPDSYENTLRTWGFLKETY